MYNFLTKYVGTMRTGLPLATQLNYAQFSKHIYGIYMEFACDSRVYMPTDSDFANVGSIVDSNPDSVPSVHFCFRNCSPHRTGNNNIWHDRQCSTSHQSVLNKTLQFGRWLVVQACPQAVQAGPSGNSGGSGSSGGSSGSSGGSSAGTGSAGALVLVVLCVIGLLAYKKGRKS